MGANQPAPCEESQVKSQKRNDEFEDFFDDSEEWNDIENSLDDLEDFVSEDDELIDQKFYVKRDQIQTPEWAYPYFFVVQNDKIFLVNRIFKDDKGIYFLLRDVMDLIQTRGPYEDSHKHTCPDRDCSRRFSNYNDAHSHYTEDHQYSKPERHSSGRGGRSKPFSMDVHGSFSTSPDSYGRHGSH